jgi:hypothetical protein
MSLEAAPIILVHAVQSKGSPSRHVECESGREGKAMEDERIRK